MYSFLPKNLKKVILPSTYERPIIGLRITEKQYCKRFIEKGELHFSKASIWRDQSQSSFGQYDPYEGCFCSSLDVNDIALAERGYSFHRQGRDGKYNYYIEDDNVFGCCFYGIRRSSFVGPYKTNYNTIQESFTVSNSYFHDFYPELEKETYDQLENEKQPNVIIVFDLWKLCDEIKKALLEYGCSENEIIMGPVYYKDKEVPYFFNLQHPMEYFLKDKSYSQQHEFRIIVNSCNSSFIQHMNNNNNNIYLPDVSSYSTIQDYYFKDFSVAIDGDKLIYELAVPVHTHIRELPFKEVVGILFQTHQNMLPEGKISSSEIEESLDTFDKVLDEKFSVKYDRKHMILYNVPRELYDQLPPTYKARCIIKK